MASKIKTRLLAIAAALATLTGTGPALAQDFTFGWNPRSGDVWVDTWLGDLNHYGSRYREPFVDEMVRYYGAPRDLVHELLVTRRWAPGDVYYACAIAQIIGRPCRYVIDEWDRNHGQGWGNVAKNLGIRPGSPEFHRLKRGFVPTYDRWARPIQIDQELQRDFPNRGRGGNAHRDGQPGPPGQRAGDDRRNDDARGNRGESQRGQAGQDRRGNGNAKPKGKGQQGGDRPRGNGRGG
ncbi:hypothetical protein [Montanilutibacter psychrotolerans]|uniref:Uncharacterized protein n=1 Tax=Montanilutibacter psychrotolerans TaxID=1327343 RepID=A0A3M8SSW9_9GAMM|nr:hypothetical protein [Lysobacter psychrotolerans]RNF84418.1 hypothetical protein EER27_08565 [Lysobacter psychrotolerans]